jgi:glycogenin glucosyltransferase
MYKFSRTSSMPSIRLMIVHLISWLLMEMRLTRNQDPAAQLDALAKHQSDVLKNKLGQSETKEIPDRPLPYGSEGVRSPTYNPPTSSSADASAGATNQPAQQPSFTGPGASWEKDETFPVSTTPLGASEEEKDVLET